MDIQYLRMVGWSLGHVVINDQRVFNLEPPSYFRDLN